MEKPKEGQRREHNAGITLIALIITIIILLILAIITIRILMNQGIIGHANNATSQYKIAEEKEKIALGYQNYKMDKIANPNATLAVDTATVEGSEAEGGWTITYTETGNVYELDTNGNITQKKDSSQDEIAKIRAGYNKYQSDKNNVNQTDLDLLRQYCIGNNDKDLLEDVLDANTMVFKDNDPIPNASTELTPIGIDQTEVDGSYEFHIYFNYNGRGYKLTAGFEYKEVDGSYTYTYPTKRVETGSILTVEGAHVEGNEETGWTITFEDTGNKYTLDKDGNIEVAKQVLLNKRRLELCTIGNNKTGKVTGTLKGDLSDDITWTVTNENVAKITETKGKEITIKALEKGYTDLTAECEGYTASCSIMVTDPRGDYINYDCYTGVDSSLLTYTSPTAKNGYGEQTATVTKNPKWKILGEDGNGNLLITSGSCLHPAGRYFYLKGKNGYVYGPGELDKVSEIYAHGAHASAGRCMTLEDVTKIKDVKHTTEEHTYSIEEDGYLYIDGVKGSKNNRSFEYYDENTKEWKKLNKGETISLKSISSLEIFLGKTSSAAKLLALDDNGSNSDMSYWLATRSTRWVEMYECIDYSVVYLNGFTLGSNNNFFWTDIVYRSTGQTSDADSFIRPVVTLASNVTIGEKVDGVWQIVEK